VQSPLTARKLLQISGFCTAATVTTIFVNRGSLPAIWALECDSVPNGTTAHQMRHNEREPARPAALRA
jgi:hypothetical protein